MQSFHDVKQDAGETRGWGEKGESLLQQARSINNSTEHKPGSSVDSPAHTTSYSFPVTPAAAAMAVFSGLTPHTSTG